MKIRINQIINCLFSYSSSRLLISKMDSTPLWESQVEMKACSAGGLDDCRALNLCHDFATRFGNFVAKLFSSSWSNLISFHKLLSLLWNSFDLRLLPDTSTNNNDITMRWIVQCGHLKILCHFKVCCEYIHISD